jgi:magnesium chelatase family protein
VASQVAAARARQEKRAGCLNARLPVSRLESDCVLDEEAARLIGRVTEQLSVSGRGLHRMLRIARTVADLDESSAIGASHLAEAIQLRRALPETLA